MLNRDVYIKDPSRIRLENDGVVNVNNASEAVLRYELETFVCEGQYANGMERILDSFLKNIGRTQQPAAWISGFFGSGKSHLAKMLAALWTDTPFTDGATPRSIVTLPDTIKAQFIELSTAGRQNGGLHTALGTLNSGVSSSVRLSLLGIIFKSVGLPEDYQTARFVMYLKKEMVYENVKKDVEKSGNNWEEEFNHFRISPSIHEALLNCKEDVFVSLKDSCYARTPLSPMGTSKNLFFWFYFRLVTFFPLPQLKKLYNLIDFENCITAIGGYFPSFPMPEK